MREVHNDHTSNVQQCSTTSLKKKFNDIVIDDYTDSPGAKATLEYSITSNDNKRSAPILIQTDITIPQVKPPNFHIIKAPILPAKHRHQSHYEKLSENKNTTFHPVSLQRKRSKSLTQEETTQTSKRVFCKQEYNDYMPSLQCVCREHYAIILTENYVPPTRVGYDDKYQDSSVISNEIENFQPVSIDKLTEAELQPGNLDKYSIEELEDINETLLDDIKKGKSKPFSERADNEIAFFDLTVSDMKNFATMRDLGRLLAAHFILRQDDLHSNNASKHFFFDLDMTHWPVLYHFKHGTPYDLIVRSPSIYQYIVAENDIEDFPDLKNAQPFYWPTFAVFSELAQQAAAKFFNVSKNAYTFEDNHVYKALKHNRIFKYYSNLTFYKYILTDKEIYRNAGKLHMDEEKRCNILSNIYFGKKMIDILPEEEEQRIKEFRDVLTKMNSFHQFMHEHGTHAFATVGNEIEQRNKKFTDKIQRKKEKLIKSFIEGMFTSNHLKTFIQNQSKPLSQIATEVLFPSNSDKDKDVSAYNSETVQFYQYVNKFKRIHFEKLRKLLVYGQQNIDPKKIVKAQEKLCEDINKIKEDVQPASKVMR